MAVEQPALMIRAVWKANSPVLPKRKAVDYGLWIGSEGVERGEGIMAQKIIRLVIVLSLLLFFFPREGLGRDFEIIINFYQALEVLAWPAGGDLWDGPLVADFNETGTPQKLQVRANSNWGVAVWGIMADPAEDVGSLFLIDADTGKCLLNPLLIRSSTGSWQEIPTKGRAVIYSGLEPTSAEGLQLDFYFGQELTSADGPGTYGGTIVYSVELGY